MCRTERRGYPSCQKESVMTHAQFLKSCFLCFACVLMLTFATGCPPTQPCSSGQSVLDIDDSAVNAELKNAVYASGNVIGVDDPDYPSRDIAIIPFQTTDFPANPETTREAVTTDFFTFNSLSLANYFLETSYGHFWLNNAGISDVVTIQGNTTDFGVGQTGSDWTRNADLARQICQASTLDWADLDKNHDLHVTPNEVQILFMTFIGIGGATRPSSFTITHNDTTYTIDQRFVYFDTLPENDPREATEGNIRYNFSTITHEMLHALFRLPDRYVGPYCATGGTGAYDMMSDNCGGMKHLSMVDKMKIGWARPKIRMRDGVLSECLSFPASELLPAGLIVNPVATATTTGTVCQYWVVENRNPASSTPGNWDRALPDSGICVWYVRQFLGATEIHLIDAMLPDQDPILYVNQGAGALFKDVPGDPVGSHGLYLAGGVATSYGFGYMSAAGSTMYAQF